MYIENECDIQCWSRKVITVAIRRKEWMMLEVDEERKHKGCGISEIYR